MKRSAGEREALWAAVCESPDDDAPRLVFADWLDDHGRTEWATFIRAQVGAARLPSYDPEHVRLRAAEWAVRWSEDLKEEAVRGLPPGFHWEFRRGFPGLVHATVDDFLEHAPALFNAAPVEHLHLSRPSPDDIARLADSPHLARLRALTLPGGL